MANRNYIQVKKMLADNGYSWTSPRKAVFAALDSSHQLSTAEIIKKVAKNVDRVSVYRTIDLYEKLGVVKRLNIGWKYKIELSDQFVAHHHHLTCLKCGQIIDIEDERHIDSFINLVAKSFKFQPTSHQFEIEGACADCQAKQRLDAA